MTLHNSCASARMNYMYNDSSEFVCDLLTVDELYCSMLRYVSSVITEERIGVAEDRRTFTQTDSLTIGVVFPIDVQRMHTTHTG